MSATESTKFFFEFSSRPMLSRDADSMYWLSRYVERSEHVARILSINSNLLMDVGELAPTLQQRQWHSVLVVLRTDAGFPSGDWAMSTRVALRKGSLVVNSSQGGGSKDTWVLEEEVPAVPHGPLFTGESNPQADVIARPDASLTAPTSC